MASGAPRPSTGKPSPRRESRHAVDERAEASKLLRNLRRSLPRLSALLWQCRDQWGEEDGLYRFYAQSFKVYGRLQPLTVEIVAALQALAPRRKLDGWFSQIVKEGTGKRWELEHNRRWLEVTRPIVEAFFHANYFLRMAVKYGTKSEDAPDSLPSGWAALLCLYGLR